MLPDNTTCPEGSKTLGPLVSVQLLYQCVSVENHHQDRLVLLQANTTSTRAGGQRWEEEKKSASSVWATKRFQMLLNGFSEHRKPTFYQPQR